MSSEDELALTSEQRTHPTFEITVRRKFEVVELCEIFFNRYVKYVYLVILSVYCFLALWSFSTVAGSAWAINIPYKFGGVERTCNESDSFQHTVLPEEQSCTDAYYFSLFLFAIIVVTLSLIDLREQVRRGGGGRGGGRGREWLSVKLGVWECGKEKGVGTVGVSVNL